LQGADAFLAREHHVHHAEPVAQRLVGVLEDRPDQHGKGVTIHGTLFAQPMKGTGRKLPNLIKAAARAAYDAIGPAIASQVGFNEKALVSSPA